jgi:hypothetical protein
MSTVFAGPVEPRSPGEFEAPPLVHASAGADGDGRGMGSSPPATGLSATSRHLAAVRRSLGWAQDSADRGDYADALGWIGVVEAIGDQLPAAIELKRHAWCRSLAHNQANEGGT